MAEPFTLRIFVADGDPRGIRLIDRMNWTGLGLVFPRTKWAEARSRPEMQRMGVYILTGTVEADDLPTVYIGQTDGLDRRLEAHLKKKDFWDRAIVFVSSSGGLNRAHVTWLEHALIRRAREAGRCHLDNATAPQEPMLTEAEKAYTQGFLNEILQILPLVNLHVLEPPQPVALPQAAAPAGRADRGRDTIIVPARQDGFERVFLGQDCWFAVRISGGMLDRIRHIAAYRTHPVSAVTHLARVARIEPWGEEGKYRLIFAGKAEPIGPVPLGDAPPGAMQGPRYTTLARLRSAESLAEILGRP